MHSSSQKDCHDIDIYEGCPTLRPGPPARIRMNTVTDNTFLSSKATNFVRDDLMAVCIMVNIKRCSV